MLDLITHGLAAFFGAGVAWACLKPRLDQLKRLTDRDARGRFVKRERGEGV